MMSENNKPGIPMGMGGLRPPSGGITQLPGGPTPDQLEKLNQIAAMAKQMEAAKKAQYQPILKTLEMLGIPLKTETVAGKTYIMINLTELMDKEYAYMTGIDVAGVREQAALGRIDLGNNQNGSTGDND